MNPLLIAVPFVLLAAAVASCEKKPKDEEPKRLSSIYRFEKFEICKPVVFKKNTQYPDTIRALAEKWAPVFGVPSSWLISQAYVESKNMPLAQNPSGATGVLQIRFATAKDLVARIAKSKWKNDSRVQKTLAALWHGLRENLLNPDLNVMLAAFYLWHLRSRFGNNHELVAAAYNLGEGKVAKALRNGLPIPLKGQTYVARVIQAKRRGYV
jgi:soluble lytic murein transglycosylase-like protein